jgi:hypothetical protein
VFSEKGTPISSAPDDAIVSTRRCFPIHGSLRKKTKKNREIPLQAENKIRSYAASPGVRPQDDRESQWSGRVGGIQLPVDELFPDRSPPQFGTQSHGNPSSRVKAKGAATGKGAASISGT